MYLSLISYKFLICDVHRQLLWWNIVVGNFSSNEQKLLTIAPLLTSCWWHNKHVSTARHHCPNGRKKGMQLQSQPTLTYDADKSCLCNSSGTPETVYDTDVIFLHVVSGASDKWSESTTKPDELFTVQLLLGLALKTKLHLSNHPYNTLLQKSKDYILVNQGY